MKKETEALLQDKRGAALTADNKGQCGEYIYEETVCSPEFPQSCIDSDLPKDDLLKDA